ncbi:hypothetical protein RB195_021613 [Necator americanus]|uniref:Uncharacterized protein n=1 Tax=Necator americanus TaxID=51031 RepID=A0ABR1EC63_NECAM
MSESGLKFLEESMFFAILVLTRMPTTPTPLLSHISMKSSSPVSYTAFSSSHRLVSRADRESITWTSKQKITTPSKLLCVSLPKQLWRVICE